MRIRMPKQLAPIEVNTFVGGLVSDATPLTFPDNASLDEDNMVLNVEGDRQRRLGMDFEASASTITSGQEERTNVAHTSFRWENAGGNRENNLLVVQFGVELKFFNLGNTTISSEVIHTETLDTTVYSTRFSYAVVDGILVVAANLPYVLTFEYDEAAGTIIKSTKTLRIRDSFGVEDSLNGVDLLDGNNVSNRPSTLTDTHLYNLRNQTWSTPRRGANTESTEDPVAFFYSQTGSLYPSNADAVTYALYPDANDTDNRTVDRFFPQDLESNPPGSFRAPVGHFIIDALDRGTSRLAEASALGSRYNSLSLSVTDLPQDKTPGGPSVVSEFAGRIFYAGFSGNVTNGDKQSPRMSSYVLFSKKVDNLEDIGRCYGVGDPTSIEEPDPLDTDGGFIRLDEAFGIKSMINTASSLFVFAANGVWRIVGNEDSGFTATGYRVIKISDVGCLGSETVTETEDAVIYWGEDGIYNVTRNQYGDWSAINMTDNKIGSIYIDISSTSKDRAQGYYDTYEKKVRWVYDIDLNSASNVRELVLDAQLGSFYTNTIYTPDGTNYPKVVGIFESDPFTITTAQELVVADADSVLVGVDQVLVGETTRGSVTRNIYYIAVTSITGTIQYSFSYYKDTSFLDWYSVDDVGVDAPAYLVTGYFSGGDIQRKKQIPYMTVYLRKTENGFELDGNGDFVPIDPSSCKIQSQWEWCNNAASKRWGTEFQAYRLNRLYMPEDINDIYDDGVSVIVTKNKIRGHGRVVSFKFSTEAGKDLHLYGWSMIAAIDQNV
jgi:hypothetical protein